MAERAALFSLQSEPLQCCRTSDLSFPTACADFSGWELLKSLELQLFERLQSDGMEMDTDRVDFFCLPVEWCTLARLDLLVQTVTVTVIQR